jgi:sensor histidine kinase regulating citrate/malate metabolism
MKCYSSNVIVNAVVREKDQKCKDLGFDLELDLMIPNKLEIEPLHVCSIFSNLLDNALEAVENMEPSKRSIQLWAEIKNNYLCMKVSNTTRKEHVRRKRRKNRGYGSLILQDIAGKYDGTYTTSYAEGIYSAAVVVKVVK